MRAALPNTDDRPQIADPLHRAYSVAMEEAYDAQLAEQRERHECEGVS